MPAFVESLNLEPGEEMRAVYHRHILTLLTRLMPWALLLVVLFLFLFPLFTLGAPGVALFSCILLLSIVISLRAIVAWLGSVTILTNVRLLLVERFGFFKTRVTEMKLDQIFKVSYEVRGMRQVMGRYGTLVLVVMFTGENMYIHDIPNPQEALNHISQAVSAVNNSRQDRREQSEPARAHALDTPRFGQHERRDPANWR